IPTGKTGTVMLSYQRAMRSNNGGFAAAYRYQLSKRTNVYAMGNLYSVRNHFIDENQRKHQFGVGLQHAF
ncbi:porin, partial [Alcaligenes pakistanensis]